MIDHIAMAWEAQALLKQLESELPGLVMEVLPTVASTNTILLERARQRAAHSANSRAAVVHRSVESAAFGRRASDWPPCLLVAEHQSAGRGRLGREWQSRAGASLTFSLGVRLSAPDWSGLSLAVGVALCEALDPIDPASDHPPRLMLKWPNDLWLMEANGTGRKLGGILIETVSAAEQRMAIIGIGLNIHSFPVSQASSGFAAVQELDAQASAPTVLARVALPLVRAVKQFGREGFQRGFAERFQARDLLKGRSVHSHSADASMGGVAQGVSPSGALLVQTTDGLKAVTSGEVSVRLDSAPVAIA